jgi:hypothetical protein
VKFQVLIAANMKIAAFCVVTPVVWEKFTDVLEVLAASIISSDDGNNTHL